CTSRSAGNSKQQEGLATFERQMYTVSRIATSQAYLEPAKKREHLDIETLDMVTKINYEGTKAKSVTYRRGKKLKEVHGAEIVLAGGAINTPQLLQLSGIGDAEHLNSLGIDPIVNLPGVGENL